MNATQVILIVSESLKLFDLAVKIFSQLQIETTKIKTTLDTMLAEDREPSESELREILQQSKNISNRLAVLTKENE